MMTPQTQGSVLRLLRWQSRNASVYVLGGVVGYLAWEVLERQLGVVDVGLPALPLAVVGGALGIFVSFRTNSAYDRWWEARKLWGGIVNQSRNLAAKAVAYGPDGSWRASFVHWTASFCHATRMSLRGDRSGACRAGAPQ